MAEENIHGRPFTGGWVWKANTYPKIRCFLWQCLHKSIPVRGVLAARGVITPTLCPLCNIASESIIHLLRDCPQARLNWGVVFPFGVWSLWLWRNKVVFRDTSSQRSLKSETIARATEFAFLGVNGKVRRPVVSVQVRWLPPPEN
ncbi:hypothetical protein CFP56_029838 [Quercus suber]|uniref:Reverse transcriptase zinc-binding domain-containing protein n=1 Tax=Quercus suber TaxID=58331 RepID=A0AAW0LUD9_QUESU